MSAQPAQSPSCIASISFSVKRGSPRSLNAGDDVTIVDDVEIAAGAGATAAATGPADVDDDADADDDDDDDAGEEVAAIGNLT